MFNMIRMTIILNMNIPNGFTINSFSASNGLRYWFAGWNICHKAITPNTTSNTTAIVSKTPCGNDNTKAANKYTGNKYFARLTFYLPFCLRASAPTASVTRPPCL
jgi:hypothetical protein